MKIAAVVGWSVLGMVASSASVAWWTADSGAAVAADARPAERRTAAAEPPNEARAEESEPPAVAEPADEAPSEVFAAPGTLRVDGRLGHAALPAGRPGETYLLLELAALEDPPTDARAPVEVAIVVDRSGSMKGKRMRNAVEAARGMLARLRPDDVVSVVAYDAQAEIVLPRTSVRALDRVELERRLATLRSRGNTCISCGLEVARNLLAGGTGTVKRVLLLSDGQANRGVVDPSGFRMIGDAARRDGIAVASIGVDVDYDERTLFAVSEASNGRHYFVESPARLPEVFEQERQALVGSVADEVDVTLTLAEGVELMEVVDRPHDRRGDEVVVSLGAFAAGEGKTVLARVRIPGDAGARAVADVRVGYRDLTIDRRELAEGALGLEIDPTLSRIAALDPRVEARLGRKDTFDALLSANAAFGRGDVATAERELSRARTRVVRRQAAARRQGGSAKVDDDFERQLQTLGRASQSFEQAVRDAPPTTAPTALPKLRRSKAVTRGNVEAADPFSN